MYDQRAIDVGLGRRKADKVFTGGKLVNVFTAEVYEAGVAVAGDRIAAIGDVSETIGDDTEIIDATGMHLVPGLIDPHVHTEVTKLSITGFASTVLPHGTTSVCTAFDQIAPVKGIDGIRYMLDEAAGLPLRTFNPPPSKIPYTIPEGTLGASVGPDDHRVAMQWDEANGIAETTFDFIRAGDSDVIESIGLCEEHKLPVHGHAPFVTGLALGAYANCGVRDDHECFSAEETIDKLRNGLYCLLREATMAHNLADCIKAVTEAGLPTRRVSLCSDDTDTSTLVRLGHMDHIVRRAIAEGVEPVTAIQMATINGAEAYRVDHMIGSISPGRYADILFVEDLGDFRVSMVMAGGEVVARDGELTVHLEPPSREGLLTGPFPMAAAAAEDFVVRTDLPDGPVEVLAIELTEQIFVRKRRDVVLQAESGRVIADLDSDVALVSVVERYGKNSNRPTAFVAGFGIRSGALASSSAPDDNNIVVIGASPDDMAVAVNHLAAHGGGQVVVDGGRVVEFLPLPIGGIVSDLDPAEMLAAEERLDRAAKTLGCRVDWPFMYLFFLPITSIPDYAITDVGTVDVLAMDTFDPVLRPAAA